VLFTSDPVDSDLVQIMATEIASPNGIFKQLDLAEKEPDSMQEGSQLAPQPTTPVATLGGYIPWYLQKAVIIPTAKPREASLWEGSWDCRVWWSPSYVFAGHDNMEITPTGQPYQTDDEMYEDPGEGGEGGGGAVAPHDHLDVEGTNGIPGDGSETPKGKRIPPPMSAEKAAYLAGGGYIAASHQYISDARMSNSQTFFWPRIYFQAM
jgi:hypothetical protein